MKVLSFLCFICLSLMSYGSKCPPGAVHYQSNCFFFMNNATNFENAELTCKNNFGAHLLSIPDLFTDSVIGCK
uniref:C-type lectin domain-containing protein n=1 Tax=Panagrolaimus superbus TaxID=310955 RepID=A0A914Z776_9BILA